MGFPVLRDIEADAFPQFQAVIVIDRLHRFSAGAAADFQRHGMVAADVEGKAHLAIDDDHAVQGGFLLLLFLVLFFSFLFSAGGGTLLRSLSLGLASRTILLRRLVIHRRVVVRRNFGGKDDQLKQSGSLELDSGTVLGFFLFFFVVGLDIQDRHDGE